MDANHLAGANYITQLMETPGEHRGNENPVLATAQQCVGRQLHVTKHTCTTINYTEAQVISVIALAPLENYHMCHLDAVQFNKE